MIRQLLGTATLALTALLLGAAPAHAGCGVNVKASYDTKVVEGGETLTLTVLLNSLHSGGKKSQVRKKIGVWGDLKGCSWSSRKYTHGQTFTVACELALGCSGKRRYRVFVQAKNAKGTVMHSAFAYHPSDDGWTTDTTIDLGDLGKLFK